CAVLSVKAELGVNLTKAYLAGDKEKLNDYANVVLPDLIGKVRELQASHRDRWFEVNKAFGWEVLDFRYGGLILALETSAKRIADYVSGKAAKLEELEETRLLFQGVEGLLDCYWYQFIPTASRLAQP
ncbi:MAG: N-acetyl-beta-D-glucosaminidase, partial [Paenibacillus sp.]|nr:N-acetyl-beta-D-glucosaminidase [Paenibacillus sp.]